MIDDLTTYARAYDAPLADLDLTNAQREKIEQLLAVSPLAGIPGLDAAPLDFDDFAVTAVRLANDKHDVTADRWDSTKSDLDAVSKRDAIVAVVVGTYALAAWEGTVEGNVLSFWESGPRPEWEAVGIPLTRALIEVGAHWSASFLLQPVLSMIEASRKYALHQDPHVLALAAACRGLLRDVETARADACRGLAWALAEQCDALAAELAALMWTLGEPVDATLVASGHKPSPRILEWLVEQSVRRGPWDPLTQDI